jgi:carboxypeptidase D
LFFAFKPTLGAPVDEIVIWLNGGPGCSSLEGFFQENGPWTWMPGTLLPVENPYTWANLSNMLWVEQPVGTGFSQGQVTAHGQEDISQDFIKWFKNWQTTFGVKNYKIFVTGESYAGRYVPYISSAMLNTNNTEYYNLSGALIYDPSIGSDYVSEATITQFVDNNAINFNLNQSFTDQIHKLDESCGYKAYRDKYLTFPPPGQQPVPPRISDSCDIFDLVNIAALTENPCFDIYAVEQQCPLLYDVLSFPTELLYSPPGYETYFNRSDVKKAMHAPDIDWEICSSKSVFIRDSSLPSSQKVIPQVIEATNRMLISNGDFDMILSTNNTLLTIQNMTWNGKMGLQTKPSTPINIQIPDLAWKSVFDDPANGANGIDGPQGVMGIQHYERGLMWAETFQSGHMQPEFQPRVTYRHLQWVLGHIDAL